MADEELNLADTLGRIRHIAFARRWWILLPAVAAALVASAVAWLLPDRYDSEATLVKHQPISKGYVLPANMMTNAEDVEATSREILSRLRLVKIVEEFNLYAEEKEDGALPEQLADLLLHDIEIHSLDPARPLTSSNAFRISFTSDQPRIAQAVTLRLTQLFIDQTIKSQEDTAERTTSFLKERVEAAKKTLEAQEQLLKDFKSRYLGELPEQQQVNLLALTEVRAQLQTATGSLNRAKQQSASLKSQLVGVLSRLQSERATLLHRFTPRHPDVVRKEQEILQTEASINHLGTGAKDTDNVVGTVAPNDPALAELLRQAEANGHEVDLLAREIARLRSEIAQFQSRLNVTPLREQQLTALLRDYDLIKQDYTDLLNKQLQSQRAVTVEERGEGSQFRLLDPPTLPIWPTGPNRLKISLGGMVGGCALGVALAFLFGLVDQSHHSEKDLSRQFALPLIVGVPYLLTAQEQQAQRRQRLAEWAVASVLFIAVATVEFLIYRRG